ncbi:LacI family DNA-binding transcriptional regulator [Trueperella pyogenes]|uniref:LacI family DNA-binding transcriptional regulator n=1 Tax=Trueperella pyogenes TaxID=1661 RepID=UPI003253D3E4
MGKRKDVTIYDIARVAGVAPSTVSRAFTSPSRVSAKTLGRIHAVARDLGFHAEGSTYWDEQDPTALGIVLRNLANPVYSDILEGFQAGATREGYSVIVVASNRSLRQEELAVDAIVTNVAGIAFPASRLSQRALSRFERTLPIVLVNRVSPGYTCVVADIAGGMTTTFEHLTSLGHREILYLSGSDESWVNAMRWRMICEIAPLFNLSVRQVKAHGSGLESGAAVAREWIDHPVSAVIAFNDFVAIGFMQALQRFGYCVPGDVSVIGIDNSANCLLTQPSLTSLSSGGALIGEKAAELLIWQARNRSSTKRALHKVPAELTVRGSTGMLR